MRENDMQVNSQVWVPTFRRFDLIGRYFGQLVFGVFVIAMQIVMVHGQWFG